MRDAAVTSQKMNALSTKARSITTKAKEYLYPVLLSAVFLYAYCGTIVSLVQTWFSRPDYSHGFIVPLASLYFIYALRNKLKKIEMKSGTFLGATATSVGAMMLILGVTGGMITLQQFSMLVVIPGLVVLLMGWAMFKALLLPLGYLVLMVPLLLDIVFAPLHWYFQLFGAKIAAMLLSTIGIPVFHAVQYIELPNIQMEVANACSGVRYLVSIAALAVPLAYMTLDTWSKRIFLVVLSLLIGIFANPVRIAIIGVWVHHGGRILHGPDHMLQGYFVSVVGFIFLFITAWVMNRKQAKRKYGIHKELKKIPEENDSGNMIGLRHVSQSIQMETADCRRKMVSISEKVWACAISIMVAAGIFVNNYYHMPVPLNGAAKRMPLAIDEWTSIVIENPESKIVTLPGPDVEMRVAYSNPSGDVVHVQIGYYEYQRYDKKFVHYKLQELYDGAETISLKTAPGQYLDAKKVIINRNGKRMLVLYWYDVNGHVTSSNAAVKIVTAMRGFLQAKTNGAIILLASTIHSDSKLDHILINQSNLAASIYPDLRRAFSND